MSFSSLGLAPGLLRAVAAQGYTEPTPVQRESIPFVLAGRDLLAGAQTGTGKTAAFVLPMLQLLASTPPRDGGRPRIRALILVPTRELAIQVEESVRVYGANSRRSTTIYGGVGFDPQVRALLTQFDTQIAEYTPILAEVKKLTLVNSDAEAFTITTTDPAGVDASTANVAQT